MVPFNVIKYEEEVHVLYLYAYRALKCNYLCSSTKCKGQMISEWICGVVSLIFQKTNEKIWQVSALEFKKWSNKKKDTLLY